MLIQQIQLTPDFSIKFQMIIYLKNVIQRQWTKKKTKTIMLYNENLKLQIK